MDELHRRGVTFFRFLLENRLKNAGQSVDVEIIGKGVQIDGWLLVGNFIEDGMQRLPIERQYTGEHFIGHRAEREEIGTYIQLTAHNLLGAGVRGCPQEIAGGREFRILELGQAKIDDFHFHLM